MNVIRRDGREENFRDSAVASDLQFTVISTSEGRGRLKLNSRDAGDTENICNCESFLTRIFICMILQRCSNTMLKLEHLIVQDLFIMIIFSFTRC